MYPYNYLLMLGLVSFQILGSCKPVSSSELDAIVSGNGQAAFSLLPMRRSVARQAVSDDEKLMVKEASRLALGIVQCTGPTAEEDVNTLEKLVADYETNDFFKHDQGMLAILNDDDGGMRLHNCKLHSPHLLSIGSLAGIFSRAPTNQAEFERQQVIWLAARGRLDPSEKRLARSFYMFLYENFGAISLANLGVEGDIDKVDEVYNPCVGGSHTPNPQLSQSFDKHRLFSCNDRRNYVATNDYPLLLERIQSDIQANNAQFLASLAQRVGTSDPEYLGLRAAADSTFSLDQQTPNGGGQARLTAGQLDASLAVVAGSDAAIEAIFQVSLHASQRGEVYSSSNRLPLLLPPESSSYAQFSGYSLTESETSKAEPNKNLVAEGWTAKYRTDNNNIFYQRENKETGLWETRTESGRIAQWKSDNDKFVPVGMGVIRDGVMHGVKSDAGFSGVYNHSSQSWQAGLFSGLANQSSRNQIAQRLKGQEFTSLNHESNWYSSLGKVDNKPVFGQAQSPWGMNTAAKQGVSIPALRLESNNKWTVGNATLNNGLTFQQTNDQLQPYSGLAERIRLAFGINQGTQQAGQRPGGKAISPAQQGRPRPGQVRPQQTGKIGSFPTTSAGQSLQQNLLNSMQIRPSNQCINGVCP